MFKSIIFVALISVSQAAFCGDTRPMCLGDNSIFRTKVIEDIIEYAGTEGDRRRRQPIFHESIHQGITYDDCFFVVQGLWKARQDLATSDTYLDKSGQSPFARLEAMMMFYCLEDETRKEFVERVTGKKC